MDLTRTLLDSFTRLGGTVPRAEEDQTPANRRLERKWADAPLPELDGQSPADYLAGLTDLTAWGDLLIGLSELEWLPQAVWNAAAAHGQELAPALVRLAQEPAYRDEAGPGHGYASVLAVRLLVETRAAEAIPTLIRLATEVPEFTQLGDAVVEGLAEIGEPARADLYALCDRYQADVESLGYTRAIEILTRLPQDDRTWSYLQRGFQAAKGLASFYAALEGDYGDPRAIPLLNTALAMRQIPADERDAYVESIMLLGGTPVETETTAPVEVTPDGKVGRNDPCPCGSGKKYKKCCGQ